MWTIKYSKQAVKDSKKIEQSNLKQNVIHLIEILKTKPFQTPPPYEKLIGDLTGKYSGSYLAGGRFTVHLYRLIFSHSGVPVAYGIASSLYFGLAIAPKLTNPLFISIIYNAF